jgi:gluconokinase
MVKRPLVLIFMGVAGCGKTTVASLFAKQTGAVFYEGDDFHPAENIEKMRVGRPLADEDRVNWLAALRKVIVGALARKELAALTCSALKAKYRAELQGGDAAVKFVFLTGSPELIAQRLSQRLGHFMPAALLASQFEILEPPTEALSFNIKLPPKKIVAALIGSLPAA